MFFLTWLCLSLSKVHLIIRIESMEILKQNKKPERIPPPPPQIHRISPRRGGWGNLAKETLFPHGSYGLIHKRTESHFHHCHLPAAFVLRPDELYWFGKIIELLGKLDSRLFTAIYFFPVKTGGRYPVDWSAQRSSCCFSFLTSLETLSFPSSRKYNGLWRSLVGKKGEQE